MFDPFSIEGKRLLVTGASSGIGEACAFAFARAGASVILTGKTRTKLEAILPKLSFGLHSIFAADLQDQKDIDGLVESCPTIDGVVFSSGISGVYPMHLVPRDAWQTVLNVNLTAPIMLTKQLLRKKKINPGASIVFISSIAALTGKMGLAPYSASKAALIGAMRPLALEVAKRGIRVNAICPAIVRTPLVEKYKEHLDAMTKNYPLGCGEVDYISNCCEFFLSDASKKITGSIFSIDGGVPYT